MAAHYCTLCERPVEGTRHIGAMTVVLAFVTAGLSLIAVPFYPKRCPICRTTAIHLGPGGAPGKHTPAIQSRMEEIEKRLAFTTSELESAHDEIGRLREERDFYRNLLENPEAKARYRAGGT